MALIWRQAISWSNDDKNLCCPEGTLDVYELKVYRLVIASEENELVPPVGFESERD